MHEPRNPGVSRRPPSCAPKPPARRPAGGPCSSPASSPSSSCSWWGSPFSSARRSTRRRSPERPRRRAHPATSARTSGSPPGRRRRRAASPGSLIDMYEDFQCPICKQFEADRRRDAEELATAGHRPARVPPGGVPRTSSPRRTTRPAPSWRRPSVQVSSPKVFQAFHDLLYRISRPRAAPGLPTPRSPISPPRPAPIGRPQSPPTLELPSASRAGRCRPRTRSKKTYTGTPTVLIEGKQQQQLDLTVAEGRRGRCRRRPRACPRRSSRSCTREERGWGRGRSVVGLGPRVGGDERGEPAGLGGAELAVGPLDRHDGEDVAVREVEGDPRVARRRSGRRRSAATPAGSRAPRCGRRARPPPASPAAARTATARTRSRRRTGPCRAGRTSATGSGRRRARARRARAARRPARRAKPIATRRARAAGTAPPPMRSLTAGTRGCW